MKAYAVHEVLEGTKKKLAEVTAERDALAAQVAGIKDEISDFSAALDGMMMADLSSEEIADDLEQRLSNYDVPQHHLAEIRAEAVLRFAGHLLVEYRYDVANLASQYADAIRREVE